MILCTLTLLYPSSAITNKTRLCVEYEIADHFAQEEVFSVIPGLTQSLCMAQCVRRSFCRGFNYRSVDGICRLHPESPRCMTPNTTVGWLYVALSTCSNRLPWRSTRPIDDGWRWVVTENPSARNDIVRFSGRFPCRIFHKGVYLPGWWSSWPNRGIIRATNPQDKRTLFCRVGDGEFLVLLDPSRFIWTPVDIEDNIPATTVIGGYTTDATPLYVARKLFGPDMMPGLYNALTKKVHVNYNGYREVDPGDVLVFIGWWVIQVTMEMISALMRLIQDTISNVGLSYFHCRWSEQVVE